MYGLVNVMAAYKIRSPVKGAKANAAGINWANRSTDRPASRSASEPVGWLVSRLDYWPDDRLALFAPRPNK